MNIGILMTKNNSDKYQNEMPVCNELLVVIVNRWYWRTWSPYELVTGEYDGVLIDVRRVLS